MIPSVRCTRRNTKLFTVPNTPDNVEQDHNEEQEEKNKFITKQTRRAFLTKTLVTSSLITTITSPTSSANAYQSLVQYSDPEKVYFQSSSKNVPQKETPTSSSTESGETSQSSESAEGSTSPTSITTASSSRPPPSPENESYYLTISENTRIDVFEKAAPSVVNIDTYTEAKDTFSNNAMEVPIGAGSGFVWDEQGHIVTNYHVVRNARIAQVAILTQLDSSSSKQSSQSDTTDFTRKVYKAKVVGVDPGKDIAVLKIDAPASDLYPISLGTSSGLKVGQSAYAIGNPFGLDHTLTVGVVSGIGREVKSPIGRPISNVIQTDAAINPGNSGGPLLNSAGGLIGINTSIFSPSGASAGIGFAIPVDVVKSIVDTLIRDGKIVRPVLGISYLESKQAKVLGITRGVLVLDVPPNSPAYKAGMRGTRRTESGLIDIGDIIIKVEDFKINTEADLFGALESFKPGDTVAVTVNRPDLEDPDSPRVSLKPKVLSVVLLSSSQITGSRFLFAPE